MCIHVVDCCVIGKMLHLHGFTCRASILTAEQVENMVAQYKSGLFWKIRQQEMDRVQAEDVVLTEARAVLKVKTKGNVCLEISL